MTVYASVEDLRRAVVESGLLCPAHVDGVWHRSGVFEDTLRAVEAYAARQRLDESPRWAFPPVFAREHFLATDYLRSFPDLAGSIDVFRGDDRGHRALLGTLDDGGDWTAHLEPAEVVLCSSTCHPLYGVLDPAVPADGHRAEMTGFSFRHEPSRDPARMQSFRMYEFVCVGTPEQALDHRDVWRERGADALTALGLDLRVEVANDPFFGRVGTMLSANQVAAALKYEIVADLTDERGTAISSANYHEDHFGAPFGLTTPDGGVAHSACFGFGLERITLAMFARHGLDRSAWPADVTDRLT